MAIERTAIDSLQHRVDEIRATGNDDLAARVWHALSGVLFEFTLLPKAAWAPTCRRLRA
jgi:hypothetical protein